MAGWIVVPDGIGITEDPGVEVAHWMSFLFLLFFSMSIQEEFKSEIWGNYGARGLLWNRLHR